MLVADKAEEFVFDESAAHCSAGGVAVQLRDLIVRRNVGILLIEKWRGIQPICATMAVKRAVNRVGAGSSAHVDVSSTGAALLRVVHRGIDAKFLYAFRSGRWQRLADG